MTLRAKLLPVLQTFTNVMMWTFTIDPKLFNSPREAWEYVKRKRCVARVIKALAKRGCLHTDRFFYVVEWQKHTAMVHFHVLVDASYVPFEVVCELWNRYRPASAGPVQGQRPGFGSVRFTKSKFDNPAHAANYACKYLIKHPEHGYPEWVLDMGARTVRRFEASRGFFGPPRAKAKAASVPEVADPDESDQREGKELKTIRECLQQCGQRTNLFLEKDFLQPNGELVTEREFVETAAVPFAVALRVLGMEGRPRQVEINGKQWRELQRVEPPQWARAGEQWWRAGPSPGGQGLQGDIGLISG